MDFHACPIVKGMVPDVGGMVMVGSPTVLINSMMACRVMDMVVEIPGGPNPIAMGATNVCIGDAGAVAPVAPGAAAQRLAASLAAMPDAATAQAQTLIEAAKAGVPFCEKCQHVTDGQTQSTAADPTEADPTRANPAAAPTADLTAADPTADSTAADPTADPTASETESDAPETPEQVPLSVFVHDEFGIPQDGVQVEVSFDDGRTERAQTNSVGNFVVMMKQQHESAKIRYTIPAEGTMEIALREDFFIEMPGTDSDDGLRRRLYNLGYLDDDDLSAAVVAFQATHGFPTTGEADQETRDKLMAVHDGDDPIVPVIDIDSAPLSEDELMAEGDQLL
jgi:hypothetical protein